MKTEIVNIEVYHNGYACQVNPFDTPECIGGEIWNDYTVRSFQAKAFTETGEIPKPGKYPATIRLINNPEYKEIGTIVWIVNPIAC